MSVLTPPARQIDPRGQRFGAGVSALVLAAAFVLGLPWLAILMGVDLALSSAFGTRWFLPSRPWPTVRRTLRLGAVEPEHEYPPASRRPWAPRSWGSRRSRSCWAGAPSPGCWWVRWRPSRRSSP
ncbi:MAG: DUF4395 family protein [Chloroflexota bacterium]